MTDPTALAPVPGLVDLQARLTAGETLYGTFTGLGSPAATELVARAGFDRLIIDLEHGVGTESELLANLHAVGATRTAALVRPQSGERLRIGRALDLGAHGIMVPRIDTAEGAREAVTYLRYPPDGTRGVALSTRGAGMGELGHADVRSINRHILGINQPGRPGRQGDAFGVRPRGNEEPGSHAPSQAGRTGRRSSTAPERAWRAGRQPDRSGEILQAQ